MCCTRWMWDSNGLNWPSAGKKQNYKKNASAPECHEKKMAQELNSDGLSESRNPRKKQ